MEENTELEEGEACYHDDDDDKGINYLDSLSYFVRTYLNLVLTNSEFSHLNLLWFMAWIG